MSSKIDRFEILFEFGIRGEVRSVKKGQPILFNSIQML